MPYQREHTANKDYDALYAAISSAYPGSEALNELTVIYNKNNMSKNDRAFIKTAAAYFENSGSDPTIALGAVQALLQNHYDLRASQTPTDYPQVMALLISNKWGVQSAEWAGLQTIRSYPNSDALLSWLYYYWATNGYDMNKLSSQLRNPTAIAEQQQQNPIGPDTSTPLPPPYGPPTPPSSGNQQNLVNQPSGNPTPNTGYISLPVMMMAIAAGLALALKSKA